MIEVALPPDGYPALERVRRFYEERGYRVGGLRDSYNLPGGLFLDDKNEALFGILNQAQSSPLRAFKAELWSGAT